MMKIHLAFCVACVAVGPMAASSAVAEPVDGPAVEETREAPVVRTEQLESGELTLAQLESPRLEALLRDLNRRKDFDASCHNGQPGPDGAYLAGWVQRVTDELISRGYYNDAQGNLHRPGTVVPVR